MHNTLGRLKHNATTVAEVALIALVIFPLGLVGMFGLIPVANFFGEWGIDIGPLITLFTYAAVLVPYVAGFCYGLKRQRTLTFGSVLVGWVTGWMVESEIAIRLLLPAAHKQHHMPVWQVCLLWFATLVIPMLILTAVTMYGQKRRMARIASE